MQTYKSVIRFSASSSLGVSFVESNGFKFLKMQTIVYILFLVGPLTVVANIADKDAQIVQQVLDIRPDGNYKHSYELNTGAYASEEGKGGVSAIGQFGFYSPDRTPFYISYTADENGFQAYGNHLPTPPPIPEAIKRALEYIKRHTPQQFV